MPQMSAQDQGRIWDVAIIGAGMGGGFTARALADAGHDVLLIERGIEEKSPPSGDETHDPEVRLAGSKWPTLSTYEIDGVVSRFYAPIGSGIGGSTNWYAAALERFADIDIDSLPNATHPTGGWPISYQELLPYYEQAERMLHVAGTIDPLSAHGANHLLEPPPLGPCDTDFVRLFQKNGLHPYRLHVGIRYLPGCDECLGRLCQKNCRTDVRSVLTEAPRKPTIMARSEVVRLESTTDRVTCAIVAQGDKQIRVEAKVFVLAAGAIHTPKLLLMSKNDHWPNGLANHSDMVGRNLMFHANQNFTLWPSEKLPSSGPRKSVCFRDFYYADGERCGCVQSTGFELGYGEFLMHLYQRFDRGAPSYLRMLRPFLRIPAALTIKRFGRGTIFVNLIEDLPYPENRVVLKEDEADGVSLKYTIKAELRERAALVRRLLTDRLKGRRLIFLAQDIELNYGHPCGTCVMSDDPSTGVVDRDCRAHGIANLFIADGSFMPTSAAINPSLTIAANALRVSAAIDRNLLDWRELAKSAGA
ncbi:GMC oxidoreductase [Acidicapsa acidisoli]|uniref:GMC oxidoreductase n=1 Tax=Acidicapsa acidisoli TaxID=1615681 RepID=UPI0021E09F88|nr:GMC family oxidoreductase [Acidicapsa acidisoli]